MSQEKIIIELEAEQFEILARGGTLSFGATEDTTSTEPVICLQVAEKVPILKILQDVMYRLASTPE